MSYLAVLSVLPTGRIGKYRPCSTENEAISHVNSFASLFPGWYVASNPGGFYGNWLCDPVAKTVVISPPAVDPNLAIRKQIQILEQSVTQRRIREAIKNASGKQWLDGVDDQIAALRAQL